jgi:phage shock protein C
MKKLYLSRTDRKLGGVCGGLAEYVELDPTIVRLIVVVIAIVTAVLPAVFVYLIAWMIIPSKPFEPPKHP